MDELDNVYDSTAIFSDGLRVYSDIGIVRVVVNETAELVKQPLEDGSPIIDHKIDNLVDMTMLVVLSPATYRNTYELMRADFISGTIFSIKTPLRFFDSMVMSSMPSEMDGNTPDKVQILIKFGEYRYFPSEFAALPPEKVRDKTNASTVKRGSQKGVDVPSVNEEQDVSLLDRILYGDPE